jgi:hypothetical protein
MSLKSYYEKLHLITWMKFDGKIGKAKVPANMIDRFIWLLHQDRKTEFKVDGLPYAVHFAVYGGTRIQDLDQYQVVFLENMTRWERNFLVDNIGNYEPKKILEAWEIIKRDRSARQEGMERTLANRPSDNATGMTFEEVEGSDE